MKAAVSRLEFGPRPRQMEVTDITTGHFVFTPVKGREVSFAALDRAITNAGYEIEAASLTVAGRLTAERDLELGDTGQRFRLTAGDPVPEGFEALLEGAIGRSVRVLGRWSADGSGELLVVERIETASGTEP